MKMTTRERLENKLEKREAWAEGRQAKAQTCFAQGEPYRGDIAFNTQPGHIPERARVIRAEERGFEHLDMAQHHASCAAGIKHQLDRSVFSDDSDAIEALRRRIAEREAEAARLVAYNKTARAAAKRGETHGDLTLLDDTQKRTLFQIAQVCPYQTGPGLPFPSYATANLRSNIRRDQQRIEDIERRTRRTTEAEQAGGCIITGDEYINVTFAEKPDRNILDALKASGFQWGGGCWTGYRTKLPSVVSAMIAQAEGK